MAEPRNGDAETLWVEQNALLGHCETGLVERLRVVVIDPQKRNGHGNEEKDQGRCNEVKLFHTPQK